MKKKILPLILMLTVALMLVGCSSAGSSSNDQAAPAEKQQTTVSTTTSSDVTTSNENQSTTVTEPTIVTEQPTKETPLVTSPVEKKEIIVSVAASLKNAMMEIEKLYEGKNSGINLTFNFGSSGTLQQQIEQGAPADLFISAGKKQMDALAQKSLLASGTRIDLLGNGLVLIVGKDNKTITSFQDLTKAELISIGTPASVPAGQYAQEALTNMKLWDKFEPTRFVMAKDVTQVLTYVESGNVDAGIVYTSDALGSTKVKVVATAPTDSHSPIIYPAAVISSTKSLTEDKAFLKYLSSAEAEAVFVKYGFTVK